MLFLANERCSTPNPFQAIFLHPNDLFVDHFIFARGLALIALESIS